MFPLARRHRLIVQEIDRELVVHDEDRHRTHRLNASSALVWRLCDGRRSIDDITRIVTATLDAPVDREVVWLVLARLEEEHLLEQALLRTAAIPAISRRQALATSLAGAAALLLEGCGVDSVTSPGARGASASADSAQSSAQVSARADPSPGPSPSPSIAPSPSPSPAPSGCEGAHPANHAIVKRTCVQRKANADAEKKTAQNQTQGEAKEDAQRFADAECDKLTNLCGDPKKNKCVRKGVGYTLRFDGCTVDPTAKTCPVPPPLPERPIGANEVAYTCTWTVTAIECTCKRS